MGSVVRARQVDPPVCTAQVTGRYRGGRAMEGETI